MWANGVGEYRFENNELERMKVKTPLTGFLNNAGFRVLRIAGVLVSVPSLETLGQKKQMTDEDRALLHRFATMPPS